jgi:hypothetical protein
MSDIKSFILNKPSQFFSQTITDSGDVVTETYDKSERYLEKTGSIEYNQDSFSLVSTQQIDLDYSKFENHTFFNSAQANVNVAFDTIINKFPFDGTKIQQQQFIDSLTGFEKYVYDRFAKNIGYLNFSNNSYIQVIDKAGANFPTLSNKITGESLIDPKGKSFTVEAQIYIPPVTDPALPATTTTQIIFQKLSGSNNVYNREETERKGFTLLLTSSGGGAQQTESLRCHVVSGSAELFASGNINRGTFNHVAMVCDREDELSELRLYINNKLTSKSNKVKIGHFDSENHDFFIGSGSAFFSSLGDQTLTTGQIIEQEQTFTGSIDEVRLFHEARTQKQIDLYRFKSVFQDDNLNLYYKFNEPTGTLGNSEASAINSIVLDSSGNSMHSYITNYIHNLRGTGSAEVPLKYEKISLNPVLFPSFNANITLNENLLFTASKYDNVNPNLITNLIPRHYFLEGEILDGVDEIGNSRSAVSGSSIPGSAKLGTTQLLSSLMFIWAKQFDELKIVIDAFKTLRYTDYNTQNNVPDVFLPKLLEHYGVSVPGFFSESMLSQYFDAENIKESKTGNTSAQSLLYIQNQLLRRFLTNIQQFIKSRGTLNGLKMLIRSLGIDPDTTLNIRFFDKLNSGFIKDSHQSENIITPFLNITSSAANTFITSSYLSGSRKEPGYPNIAGNFISQNDSRFGYHGYSNNENDGLFTSGSWTYEGMYKLPVTRNYQLTQSLARLMVTGSSIDSTAAMDKGIVANLVLLSSSNPVLRLYVNPLISSIPGTTPRLLSLSLSGTNIFDGSPWNVSFGRTRNDKINSHYSSSYFLRASTDHEKLYTTSSLFLDTDGTNVFEKIDTNLNSYGTYLSIGNEQGSDDSEGYVSGSTASYYFLNNTTIEPTGESRTKSFDGLLTGIRFWSKDLTIADWKEHIVNKNSLGVKDAKKNFNFVTIKSGSFEKLRMDVNLSQNITQSNSNGCIQLHDFSQNNIMFSGFGFASSTNVINRNVIPNQYLVSDFDQGMSVDKIRIRSFKNFENVSGSIHAQTAPQYMIPESEKVHDDSRLSIEFSIINALNKDIIKMFSTLDNFNNYITTPEMMYANDYSELRELSDVYFNRLTEKIYLKGFYKLFQYMHSILNDIIKTALPYKTKFLGTNLTIESHMLERAKVNYVQSDTYLNENEKQLPLNKFEDFNSSK